MTEKVQKKESDPVQMAMPIKVAKASFVSQVKKSFRTLQYSPFLLLLRTYTLWINLGLYLACGFYLSSKEFVVKIGQGILVPGALGSQIEWLMISSIQSLGVVRWYWQVSGVTLLISVFIAYIFMSTGRSGLAQLFLVITLVLQLLIIKVILWPLLMLGI